MLACQLTGQLGRNPQIRNSACVAKYHWLHGGLTHQANRLHDIPVIFQAAGVLAASFPVPDFGKRLGVTLFATVLQTQNPLGIKSLVIGVSSLAGN